MEEMTSRRRLTAKPHAFSGAVLSPKHARDLTPTSCMDTATALADQNPQQRAAATIPYTLWISEAWRLLGWAEPSAALFWELATMYHALLLSGKMDGDNPMIPPILSCGSTSSLGSGATSTLTERQLERKKINSVASAKELPVWLIGMYVMLHCEEFAFQISVSGEEHERRYLNSVVDPAAGNMDFSNIFNYPSLASRRLHAGWHSDNTNCTAYILRHLRKFLLLSAISNNAEATSACIHLSIGVPSSTDNGPNRLRTNSTTKKYDAAEIRRQHDDEHGTVGLGVRLTIEDLDRLDLILQPPAGGLIDEPPFKIGEFLWKCLYREPPPPTASIPLGDVEREIRQQLETELRVSSFEQPVATGRDDNDGPVDAMARLNIDGRIKDRPDAAAPGDSPQKQTGYARLRGTTIFLKPNPSSEANSAASVTSGEPNFVSNMPGRLHDLDISDCSDAHFYLLQPFEHATISACTNCTIVVGAVAGLIHITDCEKTSITTASRRILVSNSNDVKIFTFSPSPPLLAGDNRTCQFAPHNTYYDGLREDLVATGLAVAVVADGQSMRGDGDAAWPPLQCASNKWKQPIDVSKLEVPPGPGTPATSPGGQNAGNPRPPGADDRAAVGTDSNLQATLLLPASDFHILFVPMEAEAARLLRSEQVQSENQGQTEERVAMESNYCRLLTEVIQNSPFRLPVEYEKRLLTKADRMKKIQQAVKNDLSAEQQQRFEEDLNRGFREWLVSSGNLRQVLDLVHLEVKNGK